MRRNLLVAAWRVRTVVALTLGVGSLVVPASAPADPPATPPRADEWVQVWCRLPDGIEAPFERVDIRSVEQGNKDVQVAQFGVHHEGWFCQIGPF
jgi:hypothetical protein